MNEKEFVSEKGFVSKKNLSRAWNRLFGKVLNSKEEIEANTSENMIAGAEAVKEVYSSLQDSSSGESFNFGSLNGVRGFFTNPSKADDSFIPFSYDNYNKAFIPAMTSTTSDVGEVITSSVEGVRYGAFMQTSTIKNEVTVWQARNKPPFYVGFHFYEPVCVKKLHVIFLGWSVNRLLTANFKFQASNDNISWIDLKSFTATLLQIGSTLREYTERIDNNNKYLYYRLYTDDNTYDAQAPSGIFWSIGRMQFYGL